MEPNQHTAIITGATSGIGKAFAHRFAENGFNLIITGRRPEELKNVAKTLSTTYNIIVTTFIGDLTDPQIRLNLCNLIKETGKIDVLINNAGFGIDLPFYGTCITDISSMISTHIVATTEITHAVLPEMIRQRKGIIINVSSLGAFIPGLTRSMYLATKSFVHYFTESLSMEVRQFGITVQSLCPGMTRSDFHRNHTNAELEKKFELIKFMTPEEVVDQSLKALKKRRVLCIPGALNKLFFVIAKSLPLWVLQRISGFRNEESIEHTPVSVLPVIASVVH